MECIFDYGFVFGILVIDGEMVYVFFGVSGVVVVNMEGELVWWKYVGEGMDNFGFVFLLIIYKDLLIVNVSIESECVVVYNK